MRTRGLEWPWKGLESLCLLSNETVTVDLSRSKSFSQKWKNLKRVANVFPVLSIQRTCIFDFRDFTHLVQIFYSSSLSREFKVINEFGYSWSCRLKSQFSELISLFQVQMSRRVYIFTARLEPHWPIWPKELVNCPVRVNHWRPGSLNRIKGRNFIPTDHDSKSQSKT